VVFFDHTVTTLVAAWAAGALVTASVQFLAASRMGSLMVVRAWHVAISIVKRSLGVALANGAALLCSRIDVLVVALVLSASAAGIYSIPVAIATNLLLLSRSLLTATYRSIMTASDREVAARLGTALRHSVFVMLVGGGLSIPVIAVGAGFIFGDAYSAIWEPYSLLVLASACICVGEMLRHYLLTRQERHREYIVIITAMLVVNGALAAVGALAFGLVGAAASTLITYALASFALVAMVARELGVPIRELTVPRRSDLVPYWRIARRVLRRRRSAPAIAPK
jgi:O-antigen/teichoic acid export membrane protein